MSSARPSSAVNSNRPPAHEPRTRPQSAGMMGRASLSGSRPSSAKAPANTLRNRPSSAHVIRKPLPSKSPSFFGQIVQHRDDDAEDEPPRSRFGAWQGKKFALPSDYYAQQQQQQQTQLMESLSPGGSSGMSGIGGLSVVRKTVGGRQATFLERGTRRAMLDKIRVSNVAQADRANSTSGSVGHFVPRLRPKSAGARSSSEGMPGGFSGVSPRGLDISPREPPRDSLWGSTTDSASPYTSTERPPAHTRPLSAGNARRVQLLSDLSLPSLPESEVHHSIQVEPVSDALSVDGEVALLRLARAGEGATFCDDSFPASDIAVGHDPALLQAVHTWARPHEISVDGEPFLFPADAAPADVEQGALGDCYLLGALSVVAHRSDILSQLFGHFKMIDSTVTLESLLDKGLFTVQLYKDCDWHDVTVDTRIPCKMEEGRLVPCFGRCADRRQMWVPVLEKAYAKLHGSYSAIAAGSLSEAMADLTGGVTETVDTRGAEGLRRIESGELWRTLQECKVHGHLLACSLSVPGAAAESSGPNGLLVNHAYGILDVQTIPEGGMRLVKVRNPWGSDAWDGDWSSHSALWSIHSHAAKFLRYVPEQDGRGTFWMSYEDLVAKFNRVYLCRIFPLHWHNLAIRSEWSLSSAGGRPSHPTWFLNPQFRVSVPQTAAAVITVAQLDRRLPGRTGGNSQLQAAHVGVTVLKAKRRCVPARMWDPEDATVVAEHEPSSDRDVSVTLRLHPDSLYYIVPHASSPHQIAPFLLRIYSSALVELQRTPPCHSTSVRGSWLREYAGGKRGNPSFCNNPQFRLHAAADTDVMLLLRSGSEFPARKLPRGGSAGRGTAIAGDGAEGEGEGEGAGSGDEGEGGEGAGEGYVVGGGIGMCVVRSGDGGRLSGEVEERVVAESLFESARDARLCFRMLKGRRYIVVPSRYERGVEGNFSLQVASEEAVSVEKIPDVRKKVFTGEWRGGTAGGSHLSDTWSNNPQYHLYIPPPVATAPKVQIVLRFRHGWERRRARDPLKVMVGLYLISLEKSGHGDGRVIGDKAEKVAIAKEAYNKARVAETVFMPHDHAVLTVENLKPSKRPYLIIPSTFDRDQAGPFSLEISCNVEMFVVEASPAAGGGLRALAEGGGANQGADPGRTWGRQPKRGGEGTTAVGGRGGMRSRAGSGGTPTSLVRGGSAGQRGPSGSQAREGDGGGEEERWAEERELGIVVDEGEDEGDELLAPEEVAV